ncbi:MAG: hypothetical protein RLZZ387_2116 [Chloroflexota bacterium]
MTTDAHGTHFLEGLRLFNEGHYWHAHEQWEICWLAADTPDALFFKGIIQAAAALVHWQRGNPRGLRRNWEKGRPKLVAVAPQVTRIDLRALITEMDRFVLDNGLSCPPPRLRLAG